MECVLSLFIIFIVLMVVVTVSSSRQSGARQWNRAYDRIAQKFGGKAMSGGWFGTPLVRFRYGAAEVMVSTAQRRGVGGRSGTRIRIDWPDPRSRFEFAWPGSSRWRYPRSRGLRLFDTRGLPLPRSIRVFCADDQEAATLLNEGVCCQFHGLVSSRASRMFIEDGGMVVHAVGQVRRYEELLPMLEAALGVYDQAMLTRSIGIEFLTDDVIKPLDDATCRICGDAIGVDLVFCRVCKTPHHYDCWQYNGACSVYGCGETAYVKPRSAEIVSGPHLRPRHETSRSEIPHDE